MSELDRRRALKLFVALGATAGAAPVLAACSRPGNGASQAASVPLTVGLLVPQSGANKAFGDDISSGFDLFLQLNGRKLGGHPITVVTADEGETVDSGKAAAKRLLQDDKLVAMCGVASSPVLTAIKDDIENAQIPLLAANGSPVSLQGVKYIWRSAYVDNEPGKALGRYVASLLNGASCYLIAVEGVPSKDEIDGFRETFIAAGGKLEGEPVYTSPGSASFAAVLGAIKASAAKAVFSVYSGALAIEFVKQYAAAGLRTQIPLFAPGFLTEGAVLKPEGEAAKDVFTALNYSTDLDNSANLRFTAAYQNAYDASPTAFAVAAYDSAAVLDKAVGLAGVDLSSQAVNAAIGTIGQIDSPRGSWRFNQNRTPLQKWYLRQVRNDGGVLTNSQVSDLVTLG